MKNIILEDVLLDANSRLTKEDMKYLIDNIRINLSTKFGKTNSTTDACNLSSKIIGIYGGIYGALKDALKDDRNKLNNEFTRPYLAYVSSSGLLQILEESNVSRVSLNLDQSSLVDLELDFNKTDSKLLYDIIENFYEQVINIPVLRTIKSEAENYFKIVRDYSLERLNSPLLKDQRKDFEDVKVIGKNFLVEGIEQKVKTTQTNKSSQFNKKDDYTKPLSEVILKSVKRDEIVANEPGKNLIESEVSCLMHYDVKEQKNIFEDMFSQYLLFVGEPGTGKTMLARYAITYAKNIADKYKLPLSLVKLNFEDRYQYGPYENLEKQLNEISQGNRTYVVFLDEIDKKIPKSNGSPAEGYREDIVGLFLRFRGGDFVNKGNYIFIGTSNSPNNIHPAILSVCNIEEVQGPITERDKLKVLYNNLQDGINLGYVQVKDWKNISSLLSETNLKARDIVNIARNSKTKFKDISKQIDYTLKPEEKNKVISEIITSQGNGYVTRDEDILRAIELESKKSERTINYI